MLFHSLELGLVLFGDRLHHTEVEHREANVAQNANGQRKQTSKNATMDYCKVTLNLE